MHFIPEISLLPNYFKCSLSGFRVLNEVIRIINHILIQCLKYDLTLFVLESYNFNIFKLISSLNFL